MKEMKQFKIRSFTKFYNFDRFQIVVRKRFRFKIIYCNGYKKLKDLDTSIKRVFHTSFTKEIESPSKRCPPPGYFNTFISKTG